MDDSNPFFFVAEGILCIGYPIMIQFKHTKSENKQLGHSAMEVKPPNLLIK